MNYSRDDESIGYSIERGPQSVGEAAETSVVEQYCKELADAMVSQDEAKDMIIGDLEKGDLTIDQARMIAHVMQLN